MRRIIPLVTVGALLVLTPNDAFAAPPSRSVAVSYTDLDLSRPAGAETLDRRIGRAVRALCGDASAADLRGRREMKRCRSEARRSIEAQREQAIAAALQQSVLAAR